MEYAILLLISYPESDDLQIATVLMFVLISESNFKLKGFSGFFLSVIFIGVFVISRPSEPIWSSNFFTPSATDLIAFCFFSLFTSSLTTLLHMYQSIAVREMQTIKQLENNIHKLTNVNIDFQDYAAAIGFQSIENERKRISREIHDTIGYSLTNIIMMMEAASDITPQDSEKLSSLIEITRTQAQMSLQETRRALRELRINEQEQISGQKAINKLITIFEKVTGVEVSIEYGNIPLVLPDEVNSFLYRMIQEGLTNAFKHGKATRISIYFWMTEQKILYIHVRDNGIGDTGEIIEGIGIAGMKERAEKLHGKVEARYVFDGFQLFAEIPL
ncbi:sensor histidine kinase [Marispirochaeta aestuarii]|uniref:sensor histidine kinase n=1 Tax=Marispirochaeta aestuarii TaxID=1963862 RepID=UPI001301E8AA|nr:sensor histidine kinase [Marispirochaeta aestuarii]